MAPCPPELRLEEREGDDAGTTGGSVPPDIEGPAQNPESDMVCSGRGAEARALRDRDPLDFFRFRSLS